MTDRPIHIDPLQMTLPLSGKWSAQPAQQEPSAWYVPGRDVKRLFRIFAGIPNYSERTQLLQLPVSAVDPTPAGTLVIGAVPPQSVPAAAQPYRLIARRLYLPLEMQLDPPVTDAELIEILPWEAAVLHPSIGLIGFQLEDFKDWADLLSPLPIQDVDWDAAQPGIAQPKKLVSIEIEDPPDVAGIIDTGRDDIGSLPTDGLPPADDESTADNARQAGRHLGKSFLQGMNWLTSGSGKAGEGQSKQDWIRQLNAWSSNKLSGVNNAIARARNRELSRLVNMFERDPDTALRYALPLSNMNPGRGRAKPTGRLRGHGTDFSLNRLGGGMPSDPWHLPWDVHQRLRTLYTESASREIRLGRHRRAAYIFAELLGDLDGAANCLKQGGHYREAAVLYRDRLHRPLQAAECLKQGGLFTEAINLYREQNMFSEVGDLWQRLNRPEEANAAYRDAVDAALRAYDRLAAASLLEHKLDAPDEAINVLAQGWPNSAQANECMRARFTLIGKIGRHNEALQLVSQMRQSELSPERTIMKAQILGDLSREYPDATLRQHAADAAQAIVGKNLANSPVTMAEAFIQVIKQLRPEDRLLARDADRYLSERSAALPDMNASPLHRAPRIERLDEVQLVNDVVWTQAASGANEIWLGGFERERGHTVVMRVAWNGETDRHQWRFPVSTAAGLILKPKPEADDFVLAALTNETHGLPAAPFSRTETFATSADVGMPKWLEGPIVGATWGAAGLLWVMRYDSESGSLTLAGYAQDGSLVETVSLPDHLAPSFIENHPVISLEARGRHIYALMPDRLLAISSEPQVDQTSAPLAGPTRGMALSPRHSQPLIAVTQGEGATLLQCEYLLDRPVSFAPDLTDAAAAFTRLGSLVIGGRHGNGGLGHVYMIRDNRPIKHEDFKAPPEPIAVISGPGTDDFACIGAHGRIIRYRIHRR